MASPLPKEDPRPRPPEHVIPVYTDPACVRESVKGILHTIFFHRLFPTLRPLDRDITFRTTASSSSPSDADLAMTLPLVDDADLESTIGDRANTLYRRLKLDRPPPTYTQSEDATITVAVHFYEKKRKKAATGFANFWNAGGSKGNGDGGNVCWETWLIEVTVATVRNTSREAGIEAEKLAERCTQSLREAAMSIVSVAGREKNHIPPITTADANAFPYEIIVGSSGAR